MTKRSTAGRKFGLEDAKNFLQVMLDQVQAKLASPTLHTENTYLRLWKHPTVPWQGCHLRHRRQVPKDQARAYKSAFLLPAVCKENP